jgi:effector-binding domain-containing protein
MSEASRQYVPRLKTVTAQRLVGVRTLCSRQAIGHTLQSSLETVWKYLNQQESVTVGPAIALYHAISEEMLDVTGGFPVKEEVPAEGRIEITDLPAGRAATYVHVGPYEHLPQAYELLENWMAENSYTPAFPPYEIYWVDPGQVKDSSELRTELVWMIA